MKLDVDTVPLASNPTQRMEIDANLSVEETIGGAHRVVAREVTDAGHEIDRAGTPPLVSHFLHRYPDRIESPLTGASLPVLDPLHAILKPIAAGTRFEHGPALSPEDFDRLVQGGFLIRDPIAASSTSRLLYANVETCSVCNHRCSFCPVSIDPRSMEVMPQELFVRIVDEILEAADPEMGLFLNNYNEPTVDPLFLERLEYLFSKNVRVVLLTNASRLTAEKVDRIRQMGTLRYLGVNLPTIDSERYLELHGTTDLAPIRENIEYLFEHPISSENVFVVLGYDDERHKLDIDGIEKAYGGRGWAIRKFRLQNRAGLVDGPARPEPKKRLAGCELVGSRPLQHLQVVASGKVTFCCQDYYESHVVGDLRTQNVREIMASPEMSKLRRFAYGAEEAPMDFICRNCEFALEASST